MSVYHDRCRLATSLGFAILSLALTALLAAGFVSATAQNPAQRYPNITHSFAQPAATTAGVACAPTPTVARTLS